MMYDSITWIEPAPAPEKPRKPRLPMTEDEICMSFRQARNKHQQIGILADINMTNRKEIKHILEAHGYTDFGERPMNGVTRRVQQIDVETGEVIKVWPSAYQAEIAYGINRNAIYAVCRGVHSQTAGYGWRYVEEDENVQER